MTSEFSRGDYSITTDASRFDQPAIHAYLTRSYWAEGISIDLVRRSIEGSLGFGLFFQSEQIGFARVVTDRATFAYLCDVYVLEEHRGKGLGKWLVKTVMEHPDLQGLRRFMLATKDSHGLYSRFGFANSKTPDRIMEIARPGLYLPKNKEMETT